MCLMGSGEGKQGLIMKQHGGAGGHSVDMTRSGGQLSRQGKQAGHSIKVHAPTKQLPASFLRDASVSGTWEEAKSPLPLDGQRLSPGCRDLTCDGVWDVLRDWDHMNKGSRKCV